MEREMAELKLVLHVDQADHWPTAFGNLNNLTRDYPDAEIRVVVNGAGIYAFVGQSDLRETFDQFVASGVTFQVCHNALKEHHVEPTALPDFANVVPARVVALAEAQRDRFAYHQTVITQTGSRVYM